MIDNLAIGDEILTAGGIYATVLEVAEDEVTVEIAPGAQARLSNARDRRRASRPRTRRKTRPLPSQSQPRKPPAKLIRRAQAP